MIDAHQHFWRYSPNTHAWIDATMGVLRRNFLPEDLAPILAAQHVEGCVAVQAAQTLEETRWLLDLSAAHPWIRGVVGWVDLVSPNLDETLESFAANPRLKGVRHIAQDEPDPRYLARADVVRGIARLARFDLAYDVLVRPHQLSAAIELCRALPENVFVLDHLGKPEIAARRFEPWRSELRQLALLPNVSCKLSGLVTEAGWSNSAAKPASRASLDDIHAFVDIAIEAFGPKRLMIGSDWPVCLLAADYATTIDVVRARIAALADGERADIQGRTATRVYRLGSG
jgi:L-fuconolactonase